MIDEESYIKCRQKLEKMKRLVDKLNDKCEFERKVQRY